MGPREASGSAVVAPVIPVPPAPTRSEARPSVRREDLLTLIRESLAEVLDAEVVEIAPGDLFSDMGFDSLVGVEFRNRINERTGLELPAAMAYDYPTPVALAAHLAALLGEPETPAETTPEEATPPPSVARPPLTRWSP